MRKAAYGDIDFVPVSNMKRWPRASICEIKAQSKMAVSKIDGENLQRGASYHLLFI